MWRVLCGCGCCEVFVVFVLNDYWIKCGGFGECIGGWFGYGYELVVDFVFLEELCVNVEIEVFGE